MSVSRTAKERIKRWMSGIINGPKGPNEARVERANRPKESVQPRSTAASLVAETKEAREKAAATKDETDEQRHIRREKEIRAKLTGAEIMERDVLNAKMARDEHNEAVLKIEPFPRGQVIKITSDAPPHAVILFDPAHPTAPNKSGGISIPCNYIRQFTGTLDDDGKPETKRCKVAPLMSGILTNYADGVQLHWQLTIDADGGTTKPRPGSKAAVAETKPTPPAGEKDSQRVTVLSIRDGGNGSVLLRVNRDDGGGSLSVSVLPTNTPAKGDKGTISYDDDGSAVFTADAK